ncbi:helicase-related protein [Shigella sonnei]|uniref:helicase-related protein n=1 Tax=Shigella sonnei TaxID=624 RepID=UPI00069CB014|nr:helicase-related protein [Shigella sonnei]EFS5573857.1 DEAD/DEAH box helicase [Shigella sonnei]EFW0796189.1 DEAD/DEAH box helicase [Shigella sonnei]EFX1741563.1 DEAD/DEAH box helicase [Shigella sonnei]EFZ5135858.1 DEAD/DEAH box helicase [Shigella sonnei]EGD9968232.1 recombinase RecQ [Shigella sonnei]
MEKHGAELLLQRMLSNTSATFREGQWEAIDAVVNQRRKLLVVQRTGWGKSAVYFIASKIFRDRGAGPTIIISPLLALMRNQVAAAERLGITAETLNSTNREEWQRISDKLLRGGVDCLLISPERLANQDFLETANTPVLGTTATANNRVVEDIRQQLGDIVIQRGTLARESLALDALVLGEQSSRLAWLATVIPQFSKSGIVYTLTTRDAELVAEWLRTNGISAFAYYSGVTCEGAEDSNTAREYLEQALLANKIKVLVATTALGMGFDKPDLGFVIHYQMPGSIVGYYQQVGRAGRAIDSAVGILLCGGEDRAIHKFFRESAFPAEAQIHEILNVLSENDGLTLRGIEQRTNLRYGQIEKALKLLVAENPSPVVYTEKLWRRTIVSFSLDHERINHLMNQRKNELADVESYITTKECKMQFLRRALDEPSAERCGKCSSCLQHPLLSPDIDSGLLHAANLFIKHADLPLNLNKQVASGAFTQYGFKGNLPAGLQGSTGRVLSRWGDSGWGKQVAQEKKTGRFSDELVEACAEMVRQRWNPHPEPTWVCCVPSLKHLDLVPDFARRLAAKLGLPFIDAIEKVVDNPPQKMQQNRFHQCQNLDGAFVITPPLMPGPALLVDDIVDSAWTLTVLTALLRQAGCPTVYPLALASTSVKN